MKKIKIKDICHLDEVIKGEIIKGGNNCNLNHLDISEIKDLSFLFAANTEFNGDISKWDTSNIMEMESMFADSKFNGDISKWNTSNVKNMSYMFCGSIFNGDISRWDVSKVTDMKSMFADSKFNGDISKWDVSNVQFMDFMFSESLFNGDISNWEVYKFGDVKMANVFKAGDLKIRPYWSNYDIGAERIIACRNYHLSKKLNENGIISGVNILKGKI
jgi:surface protein